MLKPLDKVRNLKDPLKMFVSTWTFSFNSTALSEVKKKAEDLELRCESYSFPVITGDKTEVNWGGFKRVYAGKQTREGEWKVKFTEVWNSDITEAFRLWFNAYHNYKEGTISLLEDYSAKVQVQLLNPDVYDPKPEGIKAYNMELYDVYPTNISYPNIDASSSNPISIDATFHYNYFLLGTEISGSGDSAEG